MTTKELTVGTRVRLRSACGERDTGTITSTRFDGEPNRVEVQWDDGRRTAWRADALVPLTEQRDSFRGSDDGTYQTIPPR